MKLVNIVDHREIEKKNEQRGKYGEGNNHAVKRRLEKRKRYCDKKDRERNMNIYQVETKIGGDKHCQEKGRKEMYIAKKERKYEKKEKETERERGRIKKKRSCQDKNRR